MSMQVVLAGLFPPRGTAMEWNRRLNWQPIPIFSEPLEEDTVSDARSEFFFCLKQQLNFISFSNSFCWFEHHVHDITKLLKRS